MPLRQRLHPPAAGLRSLFRRDGRLCGGVGPEGAIGTFTILRSAFIDPDTGEQKPVPSGYGFIRRDGADTLFQHYIDIQNESKLVIGTRVEPVFTETRKGTVKDIEYFRIIEWGFHPRFGREATDQEILDPAARCRQAGPVHLIGRHKLDAV